MADDERHSRPAADRPPPLEGEARAAQEAANTLRQYDRMANMVRVAVEPGRIFRLRPSDLHDLNRIALEAVHESAGSTRSEDVCIGGSKHTPPVWQEVPRLVDEFCDYINEKWKENSAIFLSSYAMWKVNWIHPYLDGNGRTSRAISYYITLRQTRVSPARGAHDS